MDDIWFNVDFIRRHVWRYMNFGGMLVRGIEEFWMDLDLVAVQRLAFGLMLERTLLSRYEHYACLEMICSRILS